MTYLLQVSGWPAEQALFFMRFFMCVKHEVSTGHAQGKGCEKIHAPPLPSHMTRVPHLPRSYY